MTSAAQMSPTERVLLEELFESEQLLHKAVGIPDGQADERSAALLVALEVMGAKLQALKRALNRKLHQASEAEKIAARRLLSMPEFRNASIELPAMSPGYSPDLILRLPTGYVAVEVEGPRGDIEQAAVQLTAWAERTASTARRLVAVVGHRPKNAPSVLHGVDVVYLSARDMVVGAG